MDRVQYCALEFCSCCQFFIITRAGGDGCTAEFRVVGFNDYGSGFRLANIRKGAYLVSWSKSGKSPHMKSRWEAALHGSTTTLWRCLTNLPPCRPFASVQVCVMPT